MSAAPRIGRRVALALGLLTATASFAACGDDGTSGADGDGRLQVIASFYPLAELATAVGGDAVEVANLTPPGVEPHDVELAPSQVDRLEDADLVVYVGEGFQPAVADVVARRDGPSLDVLDNLGAAAEGDDPHFWLDPTLLAASAEAVADALADTSPAQADAFRANARRYQETLRALDAELQSGLANCERTEIVTAHGAFSYFANRYGLTELPIAGLSPEAEPSADRLAELADLVEEKGITTVFTEALVTPRVADALAREAGVDTTVLNPIEGLTEDELDDGHDYASLMRQNLAALRDALGCR